MRKSVTAFDVAECVISRDEHEYYGDTVRLWFLVKRGPSKNCASGPLKASSGTDCECELVYIVLSMI